MPAQDLHATQAHHAEEVLDVVLPTDDQPTKVMQPGKESFHSPTPTVTPQLTAILRGFPALPAMGSNHLNAIALGQVAVQTVTVVRFVADYPRRSVRTKLCPRTPSMSWLSCGGSAFDTTGERKTVIIGENDDFRPLPRLVGPTATPLFCPREGGVNESLLQFQFPTGVQLLSQDAQDALQFALPHPLMKTAMASLVRRIFLGQFAPLRPRA
jgi:hypothetical protein